MDAQVFTTEQSNGYLTIVQQGGAKLTRGEANALCRDMAAFHGLPVGKVRLQTDYALLDDPVVTGFVPRDEADAMALQDVANAVVRHMDR